MPHQHLGPYGREFVDAPRHRSSITAVDGYVALTEAGEQSTLEYSPNSSTPWTYTEGGVRAARRDAPAHIRWPQDPLTGQRTETDMYKVV